MSTKINLRTVVNAMFAGGALYWTVQVALAHPSWAILVIVVGASVTEIWMTRAINSMKQNNQ